MAHGRNSGAEGPCILEERQQQSDLRCPGVRTSQERPPLLNCSLPLSSAAQLSGKHHKGSSLTVVIAVVH